MFHRFLQQLVVLVALLSLSDIAPALAAALHDDDCAAQCPDGDSDCPGGDDNGDCPPGCLSCVGRVHATPPGSSLVLDPSSDEARLVGRHACDTRVPADPPSRGVFHPPRLAV